MLNETTSKQKLLSLKNWLPSIIESIKKEIRQEHLKQDWVFVKKYLNGKNIQKTTLEELVEGYETAIREDEKGEEIAEFVANCWIMKHSEIYHFYEKALSKINPDFEKIHSIPENVADDILKESSEEFGSSNTYVFCILNSVAFPQDLMDKLATQVKQKERELKEIEQKQAIIEQEADKFQKYENEINRLKDKYEKKLAGLQKKYFTDTEALKKQISALHRKMAVK